MARHSAFATGVGIAAVSVVLTAQLQAANPAGDKAELIRQAVEKWKTVDRWLIEYQMTPSRTTRTSPLHRIVAMAGPNSFYHLSAYSPNYPWQTDPFCQEFFMHQGVTFHVWPFNRTYSQGIQQPDQHLDGSMGYEFLLSILPKWLLSDCIPPVDPLSHTPVIPLEAMQSSRYQLEPEVESILGESCAIFDCEGADRLWVATAKGICVMRRERRESRSGRLYQRTDAVNVAEVAPNLWMPKVIRTRFYSIEPNVESEELEQEFTVQILRCDVNDRVPDTTFTPIFRPGTLRFKEAGDFVQISPGGEDLLSEVTTFLVRYVGLPERRFLGDSVSLWYLAGLAMGLVMALLFASLIHLFRLHRVRRSR